MSKLLHKLKMNYVNTRGYHTNRHLIIIESDDWGSIRMPSKEIFDRLNKIGDNANENAFLSNDCLESPYDLSQLFKTLDSVRDFKNRPAIITANFAVANPNFEEINIKKQVYKYEPFYETYNKYYPGNDNLEQIKNAIKKHICCPQLHCREHLNVKRWMRDLKEENANTLIAFNNKMIGVGKSFTPKNMFGYMDAFNVDNKNEYDDLSIIIHEANEIFRSVFGYESKTFVSSCFTWDKQLEEILYNEGIKAIQSADWQNIPRMVEGTTSFRRVLHYTGEKNKIGQLYTVRNCSYEPAYNQNPQESAENCFNMVVDAFNHNKPAIINSHRFNYISEINEKNAKNNLEGLYDLLSKLVNKYKDIEFISTPELVDFCEGK